MRAAKVTPCFHFQMKKRSSIDIILDKTAIVSYPGSLWGRELKW